MTRKPTPPETDWKKAYWDLHESFREMEKERDSLIRKQSSAQSQPESLNKHKRLPDEDQTVLTAVPFKNARQAAEKIAWNIRGPDSASQQKVAEIIQSAIDAQTAALAAERDEAKKLANIYHGQYTDLLQKRSRHAEELERSNSLLRERITAAVVITNWGEHNAMKCLVCGDESYDHWAFQHRSNCEFEAALKEQP